MSPFLSTLGSGSCRGLGRALRPFIRKPSITSPSNNATEQSRTSLSFASSAIQIIGKSSAHASSDWQFASDSNFSNIIASTSNDSSNKTSWTASSLNLSFNTTYYARVRYKDTTNLISDWSNTISFTTVKYLPALSNGSYSQDFYSNSGDYTFTVPANIGRLKVYISTSNFSSSDSTQPIAVGGKIEVSFDVTPGEQFVMTRNKLMFGPQTSYSSSGNTFTQANLWIICGRPGTYPTTGGGDRFPLSVGLGGSGGGDAGSGGGGPSGGGGGQQSSGGSPGGGGYGGTPWQPFATNATAGSALTGGDGGNRYSSPEEGNNLMQAGGSGGHGWYGGGGGAQDSAGGGGSSRIQVPSGRNPTIIKNENGTGDWAWYATASAGFIITY